MRAAYENIPPVGGKLLGHGYRIDGAVHQWWPTKRQAMAGAAAINYPRWQVVPVFTRFSRGYGLRSQAVAAGEIQELMSQADYRAALAARTA